MTNYIIVHDPHSSPILAPGLGDFLIASRPEIDRVTDWHIGALVKGDETVRFDYSRLCCDVERLRVDPAEARGHGILYSRTLDGEPLRLVTNDATSIAKRLYEQHHLHLEAAIEQAVSLVNVILIDAHSFSDEQAVLTTLNAPPYPDICLGFNDERTARLVGDLVGLLDGAGYSVAVNTPFSGSLLPERYVATPNVYSLMIEINKRVYMPKDSAGFTKLKGHLVQVYDFLSHYDFASLASVA